MAPTSIQSVAVYCGAQPAVPARYTKRAYDFGRLMAQRSIRLVFGAGTQGMMGAVARGVQDGGGTLLGVIPDFLVDKETAGEPLGPRIIVSDMHERKRIMLEQSDAVVALPGGLGTLDEFWEALTWTQLGLTHQAVGILDICHFYAGLHTWLDHAVSEGFIRAHMRDYILVDTDGATLLQRMEQVEPPPSLL